MFTLFLSLIMLSMYILTYRFSDIFVMRCYVVIQIIIYLIPFYLLFFFNCKHAQYDSDISLFYDLSLQYIFIFDFALILVFSSLNYFFPNTKLSFNDLSKSLQDFRLVDIKFFSFSLIFIIIIVDILLYNQGYNTSSIKPTKIDALDNFLLPNFLIQPLKVLANLKYILFLFVLYFPKKQNNFQKTFLYLLFIYLVVYGFTIGSRYSTLLPFLLILLVYKDFIFKNKAYFILLIIIGLIGISIIYPFISISRNIYVETATIQHSQPIYNLHEKLKWAVYQTFVNPDKMGPFKDGYFPFINIYENTISAFTDQITGLLTGRLNYLHINSEVMKLVTIQGKYDPSYYLNNITGIIPRILWEEKPVITNNLDIIGFKMGLQPTIDKSLHFAIGLRPLGESFLVFGWYGLITSLPFALLFFIITKILSYKTLLYPFYLFYSIELIKNDTFHSIIPSFIHYMIGLSFFLLFFYSIKIILKINPKF